MLGILDEEICSNMTGSLDGPVKLVHRPGYHEDSTICSVSSLMSVSNKEF